MRSRCNYIGASRTLDGDLTITFAIDDDMKTLEDLEKIKDKELVIEVKKFNERRSLNANAYFWHLCDLIAKKLGSNKDAIYLLQLSRYGVFVDMNVLKDALPILQRQFRFVEQINDGYENMCIARCYFGSSAYDTKEMSELIDGTVRDARDLGIETWTDEEINHLVSMWKGES